MGCAAVIIPTFNEEAHIGDLLDQIGRQPEAVVALILIADGRSTDATRAIVAEYAAKDDRIRLIDNPARLQSAGINAAVGQLPSHIDLIVRIDAHAEYPDDYIPRLIAALDRHGADSVVVRLRSIGSGLVQRAIAIVSNSRIGTGGSAHRVGGVSGFVDHGHHALFRRAIFEAAGGYDPGFAANEDAELDVRIRRLGGRIWLAGDIEVGYFPRRTLRGLARQYFRYGSGRAQTWAKHGERLRIRQMFAPLLVAAMLSGLLLSLWSPWFLLLPAGYIAVLAVCAFILVIRERWMGMLLAVPVLAILHLCWGTGFIQYMLRGRPRRGATIGPILHKTEGA